MKIGSQPVMAHLKLLRRLHSKFR